jgi:Ran GTPase-activating protein (RanGAP) involved in mRNA processing and transport
MSGDQTDAPKQLFRESIKPEASELQELCTALKAPDADFEHVILARCGLGDTGAAALADALKGNR